MTYTFLVKKNRHTNCKRLVEYIKTNDIHYYNSLQHEILN
jgi:hypothetical protein